MCIGKHYSVGGRQAREFVPAWSDRLLPAMSGTAWRFAD
jgi:hypothetical protein